MNQGNQPKNYLNTSDYLGKLVDGYIEDDKVRNDVVEAYSKKKPQSYAQAFNGLFRFSKMTLIFFHALSFIIATPLIFSLVFKLILRKDESAMKGLFEGFWSDASVIATPLFFIPAAITCLILCLLEYGQHVTLNSVFKIYYIWGKKIMIGLTFLALMFSAASVFTSGLGARELVGISKAPDQKKLDSFERQINQALELRDKHSDRSNSIIKSRDQEIEFLRGEKRRYEEGNKGDVKKYSNIMMFMSLFFEFMIIMNTRNIHNYEFRSAKETMMVNDLFTGQNLNMKFDELTELVKGMKKEQKASTTSPPPNNQTKKLDKPKSANLNGSNNHNGQNLNGNHFGAKKA